MAKTHTPQAKYGNWISKRIIYIFTILTLTFVILTIIFWQFAFAAALCSIPVAYFAYARYLFSPHGKNVQHQVWDTAVSNLVWDGNGKALDIGCGNGALTIKVAKAYPKAQVTGIDFWGSKWEYSQIQCEQNAQIEGVSGRVAFQKGSASHLPFEDGYFDAAVSNLCFHEVSDTKNKRELIREALRVVKKGGSFSFQDLFLFKQVYGDIDELLTEIRSWGINRVELVVTKDSDFIPAALKLPFMLGKIAIISGEK
ncbi:MAG: class I SAM-dependent methyltransferase [Candidatus Bathyarchaeia archaeon]|jgi:SAM-dependent methyltransferase